MRQRCRMGRQRRCRQGGSRQGGRSTQKGGFPGVGRCGLVLLVRARQWRRQLPFFLAAATSCSSAVSWPADSRGRRRGTLFGCPCNSLRCLPLEAPRGRAAGGCITAWRAVHPRQRLQLRLQRPQRHLHRPLKVGPLEGGAHVTSVHRRVLRLRQQQQQRRQRLRLHSQANNLRPGQPGGSGAVDAGRGQASSRLRAHLARTPWGTSVRRPVKTCSCKCGVPPATAALCFPQLPPGCRPPRLTLGTESSRSPAASVHCSATCSAACSTAAEGATRKAAASTRASGSAAAWAPAPPGPWAWPPVPPAAAAAACADSVAPSAGVAVLPPAVAGCAAAASDAAAVAGGCVEPSGAVHATSFVCWFQ